MTALAPFQRVGPALIHARARTGRGRAVVFANSLGTSLRLWDEVVDLLPEDAPLLRWDMRGHGLSEGPAAPIEAHAADLAAIMDRAGIADAVVCGVSMGGMVAVALAAARPDLVGGLVLACTGARIGTAEMWDARIRAVREAGLGPIAGDVIARWLSEAWRAANPDATTGWRLMLERTPPGGYAAACEAIAAADLRTAAAGLRVPAACLAGTEDLSTPPSVVEALTDLIPGAALTVLPGVGHLPPIEAPEVVARTITAMRDGLK